MGTRGRWEHVVDGEQVGDGEQVRDGEEQVGNIERDVVGDGSRWEMGTRGRWEHVVDGDTWETEMRWATAALWVRIQASHQKYKMDDISKGLANTPLPAQKKNVRRKTRC